jgi:hypothetical protein
MGKFKVVEEIKKNVKKIKLCNHNIDKYNCIICRPHLACNHKKLRRTCKKCKKYNNELQLIAKTCVYCDDIIQFNKTSCNICDILYEDEDHCKSLKLVLFI